MANPLIPLITALGPKLIDAFKDRKNYTELNTLMTSYPALGLAATSLLTLPAEPSTRDWIVAGGLVVIGLAGFIIRNKGQ